MKHLAFLLVLVLLVSLVSVTSLAQGYQQQLPVEPTFETMEEVQKIMEQQSEKVGQTVEMFGKVKEGIGTSITSVSNIAEKTKKLDEARVTVVDVVQNLTAIAEENAASTQETSSSVADVTNIVLNISKDANDLDDIALKLQEQGELFTS